MAFTRFMASTAGRLARAVAGLVLILLGVLLGGWGYVLAIVGLVPLIAAVADFCLFAPLFGRSVRGGEIRASAH